MHHLVPILALLGALLPVGPAAAQDIRTERVHFPCRARDPLVEYQIFNPDRSFLLDRIGAGTPYRGQLWQSGAHVIEIINRGTGSARYSVTFGIE